MSRRVLILGGSSEASALVRALLGRPGFDTLLSLAGRTAAPLATAVPTRIGGFGGVEGLAIFLRDQQIDILVDATHPFAAKMTRNAWLATQRTGVPLIRLTRPGWIAQPGDRWHEVDGMDEAAAALGPSPRRAFLTIGRLQIAAFRAAPQHHYVIRSIDPVADHAPARATLVTGRGPFALADEIALLRDHHIDVLVTKNSGGAASESKLGAARALGLPVIVIRRPAEPGPVVHSVADTFAAIEAHGAPRGV